MILKESCAAVVASTTTVFVLFFVLCLLKSSVALMGTDSYLVVSITQLVFALQINQLLLEQIHAIAINLTGIWWPTSGSNKILIN